MTKNKTRGWYTFEDGCRIWFRGLSGTAKKIAIIEHGQIVDFEPTNQTARSFLFYFEKNICL